MLGKGIRSVAIPLHLDETARNIVSKPQAMERPSMSDGRAEIAPSTIDRQSEPRRVG